MWFFRREEEILRLPEKFRDSIVHPASNGLYTVNLGRSIVVNQGWNVVIVVKGKPRDVLPSGGFELSLPNLPVTTSVLRLNEGKIKKNSTDLKLNLPQSFKCDLYYVNVSEIQDFPWKTGRVSIKSKLYGRYKVNLFGTLKMKIFNSAKFISLMLYEHSHITSGNGERILSDLINEEIYDSILFSNFFNPRQFSDKESVNSFILNKLNENFDPYGINFLEVDLKEVKFYGKVNEQLLREDEAKHDFLAEKLDADAILNDGMVSLKNDELTQFKEQTIRKEPPKTTIENYEPEGREVSSMVRVKKKETKQDIQNEINQSLFETSRIDVNSDGVTKIKLNKKDK